MSLKLTFSRFIILLTLHLAHYTASAELTESNHVTCVYENRTYSPHNNISSCIVNTTPKIHDENVTVEFFHDAGMNSKALEITFKEYFYIPHGIDKSFQNLICLTIRHSKLKKIRSNNLKPFTHLEYLDLSCNELSVLEPNLFQHNSNLSTIQSC